MEKRGRFIKVKQHASRSGVRAAGAGSAWGECAACDGATGAGREQQHAEGDLSSPRGPVVRRHGPARSVPPSPWQEQSLEPEKELRTEASEGLSGSAAHARLVKGHFLSGCTWPGGTAGVHQRLEGAARLCGDQSSRRKRPWMQNLKVCRWPRSPPK
ncbi:hypothetical protein NDU88_010261 [Pleurodeles waltl]|uniref:Uncharacterized protein n=1 Tax=Pleurodeles waltl TaxID=8319 RepID=A0AAV7QY58_PLEWA|nr:hypothetical protein NDU88_010261 [Pleurodeles waltl]